MALTIRFFVLSSFLLNDGAVDEMHIHLKLSNTSDKLLYSAINSDLNAR